MKPFILQDIIVKQPASMHQLVFVMLVTTVHGLPRMPTSSSALRDTIVEIRRMIRIHALLVREYSRDPL